MKVNASNVAKLLAVTLAGAMKNLACVKMDVRCTTSVIAVSFVSSHPTNASVLLITAAQKATGT